MNILIIPCNETHEAKRYPYWEELEDNLSGHAVLKIENKHTEKELLEKIDWCDVWISIDSFFQHFVSFHNLKPGIVLWGKSDPKIFGYESNKNLYKPDKLRSNQFLWWREEKNDPDDFVSFCDIINVL